MSQTHERVRVLIRQMGEYIIWKDNGPHGLPSPNSCSGKHHISSYQSSVSKLQSLKNGFFLSFFFSLVFKKEEYGEEKKKHPELS